MVIYILTYCIEKKIIRLNEYINFMNNSTNKSNGEYETRSNEFWYKAPQQAF